MRCYILDDNKNPIPASFDEWAHWLAVDPNRKIVKQDYLPNNIMVSTVFLGMDHNFGLFDPSILFNPILFETMIFGSNYEDQGYQTRCSTYEEALQMHEEALNQFPQLMKMKAFW
jgi:hypothetical protein